MAGITVRNLRDDLGFGSIVDGLTWDNIEDPAIRRNSCVALSHDALDFDGEAHRVDDAAEFH